MLNQLMLNNFSSGYELELDVEHKAFVMATCQRTLILTYSHDPLKISANDNIDNHEFLQGSEAYNYLLEIICGLKSKLVGENEIVAQFKDSYKTYVGQETRCPNLLKIIEKLFKDAKEVRSKYLLGLSQKTYASIARKHIINKNLADSVLILGSGNLADDLINQFKKKVQKIYISARNTEKVLQLAKDHNIKIVPWDDKEQFKSFPFIANSIGCKHTILDESFFQEWSKRHDRKLFVDLGSPSAITTELDYQQGVMKLDDVFKEGAVHESHKKNQIEKARKALDGIVEKRYQVFQTALLSNPNKVNVAHYV